MYTVNAATAIRETSETSFLRYGLQFPNLMVFTESLAKKVLFDADKKATGVMVDSQGKQFTLTARKEVILSAGAFQSPQLLMVSGVGPASQLKEYSIDIVADRPGVGQNMQDHLIFAPSYRVNVLTQSALNDSIFADQANKAFDENGSGMLANPTSDVLAWEKVPEPYRSQMSAQARADLARFPADWPEVEFLSMGGYFGYQRNFVTEPPRDGYQYASLACAINAPLSRATVTLKSADMATHPAIDPRWLTNRTDVEVAIAAFMRARQFFYTEAMKPVLVGPEYFPGEDKVVTDAQIEDHLRKSINTIFHASCTCKMGKEEDPMAVLDSKARVIGVSGLRVVDASSFPFLLPGHPQSTICKQTGVVPKECHAD